MAPNQASAAVSDSPALCTAPMRYQPAPGAPTVAKVWVRRVASSRGSSMTRTTCDPLPTATKPSPGRSPSPARAHAVSAPPTAHGSSIAPTRMLPTRSAEPRTGGSSARSIPAHAVARADQSPATTS